MNIIMVGPDVVVKGGISSIIQALKNSSLTQIHKIRFVSSYIDYNSKIKKLFKGVSSYIEFCKEVVRERPDFVHIHTSFGASFYRKSAFFLLCKICGLKFINHIHGAEFNKFYYQASSLKKYLIKKIYNMATITIVLSESWEIDIKDIVKNGKIEVLNNFAVIDQNQVNYSSRSNNVIFMGEVGKRKGAYDLPEIIDNVINDFPDTFFYICGNGDIEAVSKLFAEKGLQDKVLLTGWITGDDKKKLINDSRVFLLPTYNEGQPMAIIEAMSYKLPIVSTVVGGIPELVKNGENGFLEEPGDKKKISNQIIKLLKDRELADGISNNNYKLINQKYSLDYYVNKLSNVYSSLK